MVCCVRSCKITRVKGLPQSAVQTPCVQPTRIGCSLHVPRYSSWAQAIVNFGVIFEGSIHFTQHPRECLPKTKSTTLYGSAVRGSRHRCTRLLESQVACLLFRLVESGVEACSTRIMLLTPHNSLLEALTMHTPQPPNHHVQ